MQSVAIGGAVVGDRDVWRAASVLIKQRGKGAALAAAQRADELLDRGDMEGAVTWRRILKAVEELQSEEPGGSVH